MLGKRLKELRKAHNLTQVQLAKKLKVSKQSVSNWENENILPSIEMLIKIADLFSVRTDYILGRDDAAFLQIEGLLPDQLAHIQRSITYLQQLNQSSPGYHS